MLGQRFTGMKSEKQMVQDSPFVNAEKTADGKFAPGNRGGPGRPRGARNKLAASFLNALYDDFEQHGVAAIETVRQERPQDYLKVIASLLPKEITIRPEDEWTDTQLDDRIRELLAALAAAETVH